MSELPAPAPDLFDARRAEPVERQSGAISPTSRAPLAPASESVVDFRWRIGVAAGAGGAVVAQLFNFSLRTTGVSATLFALAFLPALPLNIRRVRAVLVCAYLFAQVTSVFITPFTWPMRFVFAAVLGGTVMWFVVTRYD